MDAIFHKLEEKKKGKKPTTVVTLHNGMPEKYFVMCRLGELSQTGICIYG